MLKKTRLLLGDLYGRLFVATHCAELIDAGEFGGPGPVRLRVEVEAQPLWDDLVEEHADGSVHGWQVKQQRTSLERGKMAEQLRALAASSLTRGHLALHSLEDIQGGESLAALQELCERLRQPGLDLGSVLRGMPNSQKKWVSFGRREAQLGSDEECLRTLQRLEVIQLGTAEGLRTQVLKDLRRWYEDPKDALAKLLDFLAQHPDEAVVVDYPLLRDQVLAGQVPSQRRGQTFTQLRERYLQEVIRAHERLTPLSVLGEQVGPEGSSLRMGEVFVEPRLRRILPGQEIEPDAEEDSPKEVGQSLGREPRWSRLRRQERSGSRFTTIVELMEGLLSPEKLPSRMLLIEGPVGSGKSMLLEQLRQELAREGLRSALVALPVLLDASALADGKLDDAFRRKTPLLGSENLLENREHPRIYLVDGLDEVAPQEVRTVSQMLDQLSRSRTTVALVLASRPSTPFPLPQSPTRLRISSWTEQDIERFLTKWYAHRPEQVDALGESWREEPMRSALANPLTATFSLLLAEENPETLRSRTALFGGIIARLFQEWVRLRDTRSTRPSWGEVSKALQMLALEAVSAGRETLDAQDIRRLLRSIDPERDREWLNAASVHFGLLVRQGRDAYRFVLRGLAEYLAGMELYQRGEEYLLGKMSKRWAEEPVRHAIGITAERDGSAAALALLKRIIPSREPLQGGNLRGPLRATLIAARVAQDLGAAARPIAEQLAGPLTAFLTDPTSTWMPERISEVVRDLAHGGGPCWDVLNARLRERLRNQGTLAAWVSQLPITDWRGWLSVLRVSDPSARAIATYKLTQWVDVAEVRDALLLQFFDSGRASFGRGMLISIIAGMALRRAARDERFVRQIKPALLHLLEWKSSFLSGVAALALLPDEANPQQLVAPLHALNKYDRCPREVLEALAASPEGRVVLEASWPNWSSNEWGFSFEPSPIAYSDPAPGPWPPLTEQLLPVVLRAMGPALARMTPAERYALGLKDRFHVLNILCEEAVDHPEGILGVLETTPETEYASIYFSIDAQLALRDAASRHPKIARALIELGSRCASNGIMRGFPGLALDVLIGAGDEEAAHIFTSWLERILGFTPPLDEVLPISTAALKHPVVRTMAIARARSVWKRHFDGALWIYTAACMLASLRPAWEGDTILEESMRQQANRGGDSTLSEMVRIFQDPPFPEWLRTLLLNRIKAFFDTPNPERVELNRSWLEQVERMNDVARLQPLLESLTSINTGSRYTAADLLLGILEPAEARALSQRMSVIWPQGWSHWNNEADLSRLVAAHPSAWNDRLQEFLNAQAVSLLLSGVPLFQLMHALLPRLSREEQQALLERAEQALRHFQHPWLYLNGVLTGPTRRPADVLCEIIFDSDVE